MGKTRLTQKFLKALEGIRFGVLTLITPEGERLVFKGSEKGAAADCHLHDWSVVGNLVAKGELGFVEDYRNGLWETNDLPALLIFAQENRNELTRYTYIGFLAWAGQKLLYFFRRNSRKQARENIRAHYDLGNAFYALWLDPSMTYSSALFRSPNEGLAQGQQNKYDRIIERLGEEAGRVLEIGCGWGGFARRAEEKAGHAVRGITISDAQYDYARSHIGEKSEIVLEDYRDQQGLYDYIVSIEMIEAVGEKYWPVYFAKLAENLKRGGKAVVQAITIEDASFRAYRYGADMIRTYIFPGGMLMSPSKIRVHAARAGLKITDYYQFGQDYALTLRLWLERFDTQSRKLVEMGYDESFQRLWRFYLAACIAGFTTGNTNVAQVELQHAE